MFESMIEALTGWVASMGKSPESRKTFQTNPKHRKLRSECVEPRGENFSDGTQLMDWRLFATTFGAIFLAELGDKTQLATLGFAAGTPSRMTIFLASSCALVATSAIAVLAGDLVARAIPPVWIRRASGVAFVVIGHFFLADPSS